MDLGWHLVYKKTYSSYPCWFPFGGCDPHWSNLIRRLVEQQLKKTRLCTCAVVVILIIVHYWCIVAAVKQYMMYIVCALLVNDHRLLMLMYRRHAVAGFTSAASESQIGPELSVDLAQLIRHCYKSG